MSDKRRKIGQGLEGILDPDTPVKKEEKAKQDKLFCPINADLKIRVNLYKAQNKVTLTDIVEAALVQYLDKEEKE